MYRLMLFYNYLMFFYWALSQNLVEFFLCCLFFWDGMLLKFMEEMNFQRYTYYLYPLTTVQLQESSNKRYSQQNDSLGMNH